MARGAGATLLTLVLLALAGPASAATPQQTSQKIFADLADNGRLDGRYTRAQIDRALHSPSLQRYELRTRPAQSKPAPIVLPPAVTDARGSLPFSGLDLALFGGVGGPLLLIGASLGRVARVRAEGELRQ
jgi:hypothetical protein